MAANPSHRRSLIDQLAWQQEMGIDEVLLDDMAADVAVPLSALTGSSVTSAPAPVMTPVMAAPAVETAPPDPSSAGKPEDAMGSRTTASPATMPSADLATVTSLESLRSALEAFEGCALKHTASNMIFADGNPAARLMVVAEVPGRDEDLAFGT